LQQAIQIGGRDAAAIGRLQGEHALREIREPTSGLRGHPDDGESAETGMLPRHSLLHGTQGDSGWQEVPLVRGEQDASAGLQGSPDDASILVRHPLRRIQDDGDQVAPRQHAERADGAVPFETITDSATPPDSRGVDQDERSATETNGRIDRVSRRSGGRRHDDPIDPEQSVQERRLADVRPPDQREARSLRRPRRVRIGRGEVLANRAPKLLEASPMRGGRCDERHRPEAMKVVEPRIVRGYVDLVDGHDERTAGAPEKPREIYVRGSRAGAAVDDQDDTVGISNRAERLLPYGGEQGIVVRRTRVESPRVDAHVGAIFVDDRAQQSIPSDSGLVVHYGSTLSEQTVEERRFADVRSSNQNDDGKRRSGGGLRHASSNASSRSGLANQSGSTLTSSAR